MAETIYIFFPAARANPVYQGWLDQLKDPFAIVQHYDTQWTPPDDAALVVTHNHYRWEELSILRRVVNEGRVPILILADGILEYRNTFEHPDLADGSMFKPLMGHKLACIGPSQARWLEAWGNVGKCEITGIPRFDTVEARAPSSSSDAATGERPAKILVATASTPWFNESQRADVVAGIEDVRDVLSSVRTHDGRPVEPRWRMNEELHRLTRLGAWQRKRPALADLLKEVDAVITTPSTVQLESALYGLPVAVLDYHNSPRFTPMAWSITCREQIAPTVHELLRPPPGKQFVQDALLADALWHRTPATPRMLKLIEVMVDVGRTSRREKRPFEFPPRILGDESAGPDPAASDWNLARLFPDNADFVNADTERLRMELSQARAALGEYPDKFFDQRSANHRLRGYIDWLRLLIRNRADSLNEVSGAYQRLRSEKGDRGGKIDS